jgi:hypothetical protein
MIRKIEILFVGHTDQKRTFEKLDFFSDTEINLRFINIHDYINSEQQLFSKVNTSIYVDRYATGSVQHGLLPSELNKKNQLLFIKKLQFATEKISEEIIEKSPDLVLLEKNNYVGKNVSIELDKKNILNGIFFPLRYDNNFMYFERKMINDPYRIDLNNSVNVFNKEVDYLKQHRTDSGLFGYFAKRKKYKQNFDYRLTLLNRSLISRLLGWSLRFLAKYQFDKIKSKIGTGVYFYLHHQPEVALEDCRQDWYNQIAKVEEIRMFLSPDIPLYVKESPSMLYRRSLEDYQRLYRLPNTFLVDSKSSTEKILKKAILTITVSGTVALESVSNGIPAVMFHHSWFSKCPGITVLNSTKEINTVNLTHKFNKEKSNKYLIDLAKKISFKGRTLFLGRENVTKKDFINYIKAIKELVNSNSKINK